MIQKIDDSSVHKICSGQVILDCASAIKELVENSLDAKSKFIEIKLKDHGFDSIEVTDDGEGIKECDYPSLALKHCTSKLQSFSDLEKVSTFGFRGEALSALASLGKLFVSTSTQTTTPKGVKLEFGSMGQLLSQIPCAREKGTTVTVQELFKSLPVRCQEFKKRRKKEFAKCISMLQGYAVIQDNVALRCIHMSGKGRNVLLSTTGRSNMADNVANIFGNQLLQQLMPCNMDFEVNCKITGFISKPLPAMGRNSSDRQFLYINSRPCELPKLAKALNQIYKSFNPLQYPCYFLNLELPFNSYDVNVTPDKRSIFVLEETNILGQLKEKLFELYGPCPSDFSVQTYQPTLTSLLQRSSSLTSLNVFTHNDSQETAISEENEEECTNSDSLNRSFSSPRQGNKQSLNSTTFSTKNNYNVLNQGRPKDVELARVTADSKLNSFTEKVKTTFKNNCERHMELDITYSSSSEHMSINTNDEAPLTCIEKRKLDSSEFETVYVVVDTARGCKNNNKMIMKTDTHLLKSRYALYRQKLQTNQPNIPVNISDPSNPAAETCLVRTIHKKDFSQMRIIGQFNLGFIIAQNKDCERGVNDLYIVDQHAADEKFNFERYQRETKIHTQPLVCPKRLNLTLEQQVIVEEHRDILNRNGFSVAIDEDAKGTKTIHLTGLPQSKTKTFGISDLEELIHLISEYPENKEVACSAVRAMYASRACRTSVMIGTALKKSQMLKIVQNMGEMNQPWNCPHGRPTMRHLCTLN